jgi:hypothetical protein
MRFGEPGRPGREEEEERPEQPGSLERSANLSNPVERRRRRTTEPPRLAKKIGGQDFGNRKEEEEEQLPKPGPPNCDRLQRTWRRYGREFKVRLLAAATNQAA